MQPVRQEATSRHRDPEEGLGAHSKYSRFFDGDQQTAPTQPLPGTDAEIACSATGTACLFEAAANPGAAAGSAKPAPWAHQLLMNFRLSRSGRSTELPPVL